MKYPKISYQLIRLAAVCMLLQVTTLLSAQEAEQKTHKTPLSKMELQTGDSIVFLGDSITHQCLYTQYVEDFFYTRYPKMRLKFHNAGVGGAKAWDALARFDRDVAAYHPKYVTVLLGMND
ncbi:MAG: GDSL-type esterase/lipase family protein, partial [Gimesia chilikensis]